MAPIEEHCFDFGEVNDQSNYNRSSIWNQSDLADYSCRFSSYLSFQQLCKSLESHLSLICGIFGFLGALCMVLTLARNRFRPSPDFLLFRVVGYLEMVQMAIMTGMAASSFCKCEDSYICAFIWAHLATTVMNICADTVDLIVLFLCIERTVACLFPQHFRLIRMIRLRQCVILFSFLLPCIFSLVHSLEVTIVYDEIQQHFLDEPSKFAQTQVYFILLYIDIIRFYITACLIAAATLFSILGLATAAERRRRLTRRPITRDSRIVLNYVSQAISENIGDREDTASFTLSTSNSSSRRHSNSSGWYHRLSDFSFTWRRPTVTTDTNGEPRSNGETIIERRHHREVELCCLQLCLAIPIVVNQILYASGLNLNYSFIVGRQVFESGLGYEMALVEIGRAWSFHTLRTATNISNILAHALHFYLYLIFSVRVRRDFMDLIGNWKYFKRNSVDAGIIRLTTCPQTVQDPAS